MDEFIIIDADDIIQLSPISDDSLRLSPISKESPIISPFVKEDSLRIRKSPVETKKAPVKKSPVKKNKNTSSKFRERMVSLRNKNKKKKK